ncbi:unnamed protein product [Tuber melanosporum]|uniref:(Perigord truffle) hypothetical protein n=1 Tax=Tuber melanosporum (strain Mel28) TaxID=656061 RepID=D5GH76_TUBMM|nr:uncharacterized protein GSTUM_00007782001 [Tuber melanosporum]CAZ83901.1 unnamed protein product [Tuber melanosporum]
MTYNYNLVTGPQDFISIGSIKNAALELLRELSRGRRILGQAGKRDKIAEPRPLKRAPTLPIDQTRPIIFIGYQLGGTIIKQALVFANYEKLYMPISSEISLLVFFGTPHRAATPAQWESAAEMLLSSSGSKEISSSVLKSSSKALMDSSAGFMPFLGAIPVLNFYDNRLHMVSILYLYSLSMDTLYFPINIYYVENVVSISAGFLN